MTGRGEGAAGRPRCQAALSPPTPFAPWPRAAIPAQQPLRGPKAGAPTVPPGPGSRSLLGQFWVVFLKKRNLVPVYVYKF